jgi:hypothetical protein
LGLVAFFPFFEKMGAVSIFRLIHKRFPGSSMVEHPAVKRWYELSRDKWKYSDRRDYLINAVRKRRRKIRQLVIEFKGAKCEVCGYDRCPEVFEFHHLDSSKKGFGISFKGYTRG